MTTVTFNRWSNPDGSQGGKVASTATLAKTATVHETAVVDTGATIGDLAYVGQHCYIGHDATLSQGVYLCGFNSIGSEAKLGISATVDIGAHIGNRTTIGADVYIGKGSQLFGAGMVIGNRARIRDGVGLYGDCVIGEAALIGQGSKLTMVKVGEIADVGQGANLTTIRVGKGADVPSHTCLVNATYSQGDWLFTVGPQGSRMDYLTALWSADDDILRWWVGNLFGVETEELRETIALVHKDNPHYLKDYLYAISTVERHPGLRRARALAGHLVA